MAQTGKVITIPVQFKEAGNTMAQIMQTLQKAVREVDLESNLGKKVKSMMNSLQSQLDDYTQLTLEPTIDQTGLRKAERMLQTFAQRAGKIDSAISSGSVFDFNLSKAEIDDISGLTAQVRELNAELAKLKKNGSNRATDSYLQEIGEGALLDRARKASKTFKSDASLGKNQAALEAETKQARDNIARLQAEQVTLQQQADAIKAKMAQQQTALRNAQRARDRSKAVTDTGNFLTQFESFNYKSLHTESGQLRGQTAVLNKFMDALMKDSEGGRIAEHNRHGAEMVLKQLGMDPATIETVLSQQGPQIRAAIARALDITDTSSDMISEETYDRLRRVQSSANSYMRRHATDARYIQYEQEQQAVRDAQADLDRTQTDFNKANKAVSAKAEEVRSLQATAAELESVTQALANFANALNQLEVNQLQGKIDNTEAALEQKKNEIKNRHTGKTNDLPAQRGDLSDYRKSGMDIASREQDAIDEAKQFTENLKQSIRHWMSAQQVINIVKDGIRQAYQDIQGLDKAMTNIAVVTDMSIGDLWGKINEYMSIAQQYGVTTQGVYEVSQLYYQQGLSTAEVMAATTETLKMARIAGMGYAEAADAMTVAIRAFKMEMSDAQHVTDVYSKVAAVTASDTEELAIAMSKTASSAESVGSSFENTTAMLAVMIETTRESAQNLGSALKSIISRYGEMKVGLTVDSEGEEIDYNKVDTALKSVGISIKDAQGQFRDFDDVIFELSEKWDSLDKNTQRYIATIMAGNRQQSRFIALVDNWERLDEVAGAAHDSEDAGLLQYAKTLDSVETKLNNIKTSFQQFYMSVFNGEFVGGILDFVNSIIKALNKLGTLGSIFNIATIISGLKTGLRLIVNLVGAKFAEIYKQYQLIQQQMTQTADQESRKRANIQAQNEIAGQQQIPQGYVRQRRVDRVKQQKLSASSAKIGKASNVLSLLGLGVNILGTASIANNWFGDESRAVGTGINAVGNTLSGVGSGMGIGAAIGSVIPGLGTAIGAAIGGVIGGIIPAITGINDTIEATKAIEEERYARLSEELEQDKIESAKASEKYKSLNSYIDQLKALEETRFDSDEDMQKWIDLNAEVLEAYPELFSTFDEQNNAIVDLIAAEGDLTQARLDAAEAAKDAADTAIATALSGKEIKEAENTETQKGLQQSTAMEFAGAYDMFGNYGTGQGYNISITKDQANFLRSKEGKQQYPDLWNLVLPDKNRLYNSDAMTLNLSTVVDTSKYENLQWLIDYRRMNNEQRWKEIQRLKQDPAALDALLRDGKDIDDLVAQATNLYYKTYESVASTFNTAEREVEASSQALNAAVLAGVRTYIDASTLHLDKDNSYLTLGNAKGTMQSYLYDAFANSNQDWETWTTSQDGYIKSFEIVNTWFTDLYAQLDLLGQVDDYNDFVKNSKNYTPAEFEQMLDKFPIGDELRALLMAQFQENFNVTRDNFSKALDRFDFGQLAGKDATQIAATLPNVIPQSYTDEVIEYADYLQTLIDSGSLTSSAAGSLFDTYISLWQTIDTTITDADDKLVARRLLVEADLTSAEGVAKLIEDFNEAGIDIDEATIKSLLPASLVNLNTSYISLQKKIANNIDKTAAQLSDLEKGIDSYTELLDLADKFGLSIEDDFTFSDGKWFVKLGEATIAKITEAVQTDIDTEKGIVTEAANAQISTLNTSAPTDWYTYGTDGSKTFNLTYQDGLDTNTVLGSLKGPDGVIQAGYQDVANIISSNWDAYIAWYGEQEETANRTFVDYLIYQRDHTLDILTEEGQKLTNWQIKQLRLQTDKNNFTSKYKVDLSATGLNELFDGSLIDDATGAFNAEWGYVDAAGELVITNYSLLMTKIGEKLGEGSDAFRAWQAVIDKTEIEKNNEAFNKTYKVDFSATGLNEVLNGTLIDAEGVFNADWGSVDAAGNLLIEDYEALLDALAEVLGEDSEAFRAWRKAIIAQSADVEKDVNKSLVDVISKMQLAQMYGLQRVQLTNEEVRALYEYYAASVETPDDFDTWADYHGFLQTGTGYEFETAYANGEYSWDEFFYSDDGWLGVTGALDTATTTALYEAKADLIKTIEGLNLDSDYSSVKKFYDAGILTEEQYQAFFTSGQTAYEYLMGILSQSANAEVQAAVKKAQDAVALEEALELDSSRLNLEDNFINLFQNISETSLQDIQGIYEQIHGEDSFTPEIAARYQTALDQAREGTVQPLINLLYELVNMANSSDKGFEVDTTKLNSAYKDANNSLVSGLAQSLSSGLSGTLSNIDFDNLVEQIGGVPEDYRRYVTETYDGLKLSAEGVLVIASKLIDKFGNTSLVAESLVEQLGGSGALGSYKDVDDLINEIVNDTNHWAHGNEDILNLLYQMRAQYSQLAEDARFDFMNQDHFGGAADNWYTLTDNISTAIDTLKSAFEKGGKIDYKSFDNIITWISDLSVDGLDTKLGETGVTLGQFTDAVLATVDATGNLDLSAAAANLGISMDDMAGALEGGLQEVAKQQVAYWKKYLDFLKGLKKLQEAQDEVSLHIPIQNEVDGTWTYEGNTYDSWEALMAAYGGNLGMDLTAAQQFFDNFTYTGENGTTITLSGKNNPLNFILGELDAFEPDGTLKAGMEQKIGQYIGQVFAWINTISEQDIDQYINEDTGEITIPWSEILQIELDTSTTPEANATNTEEAGEQTQDAAEGAAESALTASGATPNGDGSYTYTLDDMTLKIQMGANGSVEIDLTNATGTLPSAAELRKVFEGQEGFTATDDNNWVFTDPNLGFSVKCSNGTLSFDTSGMTAPAAPTAAELSAILGTTWTTEDGGKTYTTNLNGVSFVYKAATGQININASSFQLTGGLDDASLRKKLGGNWVTKDNGATYTATIAGTSFVYENSSGLVKIDGSKFTLSGGLSPTELKNILGGDWSSSDGGITYESTINGVTFTYKSDSGTVEIDSSKFTLSAELSAKQLTALLGGDWDTEDGITYKSVISGVTFIYESTTGTISVDPSGFTVSANLTEDQLKTLLGDTWTLEDDGTYKNIITGATFTYESTTGKLVVTPPTAPTEPTNADFVTLMQNYGWTHNNGVYTKEFVGGTLTYNATGALTITPSSTMTTDPPDTETLLNSAFGENGWEPNKNGGYNVLNAETDEILFTFSAEVNVIPTAGSNVTLGDNGLTADVDVILTPNTKEIDGVLSGYEQKTINLTIGIDRNSLIKSSQHFKTAWDTLFKVKNQGPFDFGNLELAKQSFDYLVAEANELSKANKLTQEDLALIIALGNAMNEVGINVDSETIEAIGELPTVEENTVLVDLAAFAEAFNGANLFGNLTALTALLTAMNNPAAVSLDLTDFITQLQSMDELELDDEEINNFVTAITALTTAITALPTEVDVSVKVSAGNSYNVIDSIKNALDGIKDKTVTIVTQHVDSGSDKNHGAPTGANYTGNVSGLSLAKGNATDKLLIGAHLAGKTLVGELGPELAVYDNQYHLLGRNGAEFVDLPNDAIVFNHRQTNGIIKGQAGYRGQALVNGNITGPAAANGIDAAISAVERIIKLWSNIADSSISDLLSRGGGGGGGGSTAKAVTAELQEWYNLMRKIEYLTQEITNLEAKRANILEKEGEAYLRNLRQTQALLEEQKFAQQILVEYQQAQLERQAAHINEHSIWGRFLRIDENGLLQYIDGNEDNDGKGALDVLDKLNDMSAEQQQDYVIGLGYSATDEEGKALEGSDLVQQFFEDFQAQIDEYDSLYDTVHQTEEEIQSLISEAAEIEKEILENQKELEEEIYDIIVEGFEKSIEELEEYTDLVKEANEEYVKGLKDALDAEKDMYDQNESISDRESLQRQLSLLRRSGGSASEIADLEEQLNDALKDEYFNNQKKMIENIEDANEEQIRKLEEQIRLQEEALEYQKENGVIWTEVYKVLDGTKAEILAFMQGNAPDFFSKSALAQEQALNDWSHKIGIFTEDRIYKSNFETADFGFENWDIWSSDSLKGLEKTYNKATEEQQATGRKYFNQVYANALMEGATEEEAKEKANKALGEYLGRKFTDDGSYEDTGNIGQKPTTEGKKRVYYGGYTESLQFIGGKNCYADGLATAKSLAKSKGIEVEKGNDWFRTSSSPVEAWRKSWRAVSAKHGELARYKTEAEAKNDIKQRQIDLQLKRNKKLPMTLEDTFWEDATAKFYSTGGLVDYTGVAVVHGSKSKPESFLNAAQTAQIKEALQATHGKENLLNGLYSTIDQLRSLIHNISTIDNSTNSSITIAPGAVVINVDQLADSYDVDALSADIMNRMVSIASKATNRGVNRR